MTTVEPEPQGGPDREDTTLLALRSLDARITTLEQDKEKNSLKRITENAGAIALFLGLILTLGSLWDVFVRKPDADRISRITQFNQAVNSAAKIRQEVTLSQMSPGDPAVKMALASASVPRILNEIGTARAILPDIKDSEVTIPQLIILITESFTTNDIRSMELFVARAVAKTDAPPYLRSEAKRYQARYLYATGKPADGGRAFQEALELLQQARPPLSARAYDIADWIVLEFTYGDCQTATKILREQASTLTSPTIAHNQRSQIIGALTTQLEQIRGGRCTIPDDLGVLLRTAAFSSTRR